MFDDSFDDFGDEENRGDGFDDIILKRRGRGDRELDMIGANSGQLDFSMEKFFFPFIPKIDSFFYKFFFF